MNKCACGMSEKLVETFYNTSVCPNCGTEKRVIGGCTLQNVGYTMTHSPFIFGYSRVKRFSQMLGALLFPCSTPQDNKMVEHLFQFKDEIETKDDLLKLISSSSLRDKRFHHR